jgi:cell wall-associated NlpC family hydrolase
MSRRSISRGRRIWPALLLLTAGLVLPFLFRPRPAALPERVAQAALSQVGRVEYFWGGKSLHMGPDPRWGMLTRVTSAGSDTTGMLIPFGLDCSGLVSWAAANAAKSPGAGEAIGQGAKAQFAKASPVSWRKARPGDLAFFPDLSHVGIIIGWGVGGRLRVVHASKSLGGVVLSENAELIGFTQIARPKLYRQIR